MHARHWWLAAIRILVALNLAVWIGVLVFRVVPRFPELQIDLPAEFDPPSVLFGPSPTPSPGPTLTLVPIIQITSNPPTPSPSP